MKILKLRFKNLNSLAGEWSIDFSHPDFINDGIFAITGQTGAGKSTILDAISLALYGRTPRLKVVSKSVNEIMSRQTADCFSELEFQTEEGKFLAFWSQRKARDKADGTLQNPKHEISELESGKVISSEISSTRYVIEQVTGMDFERFIQSMMLAQGGFAKFLQASSNDRAPILEQITGTEIYSQISIIVFNRTRDEKTKLENLESFLNGINILSQQEEDETHELLEKVKNESIEKDQYFRSISEKLQVIKKIKELETDLAIIVETENSVNLEIETFKPEKERLAEAKRAMLLDGIYASLVGKRQEKNGILVSLKMLHEITPGLLDKVNIIKEELESAHKNHEQLATAYTKLMDTIKGVREIDLIIKNKEEYLVKFNKQFVEKSKEVEKVEREIAEYKSGIRKLNEEAFEVTGYLESHTEDQNLLNEISGIEIKLDLLCRLRKQLNSILFQVEKEKSIYNQSIENLHNYREEYDKNTIIHEGVLHKLSESRNKLDQLMGDNTISDLYCQRDYIVNKIAELNKIASLDSERKKLIEGNPCSLCGSIHHPWALGNVPELLTEEKELLALSDIINKHDILNRSIEKISQEERIAENSVTEFKHKIGLIEESIKVINDKLENLTKEIELKTNEISTLLNELEAQLIPFKLKVSDDEQVIEAVKSDLLIRNENYKVYSSKLNSITESISIKENQVLTKMELLNFSIIEKEKIQEEISALKIDLEEIKRDRFDLFSDKNPDEQERLYKERISQSETGVIKCKAQYDNSKEAYNANLTLISENERQSAIIEKILDQMENEFCEALALNKFFNEEKFLIIRLSGDEISILESREKELSKRIAELTAVKVEKTNQLQIERAKQLEDLPIGDLIEQLKSAEEDLKLLMEQKGAIKQKLDNNRDAKFRSVKVRDELERQKEIYEKWHRICTLIGSADGKKYRNFAQGLTLEVMIAYANLQLSKLSDRYLLTRDKNDPLEINVIDNYQAGEVRTTKNLSGGETFLVSMALALGLSRMAGKKIKVDSLFLDEGFDTLDEETLETALGTLASLKQEGKLIGVISHVGALKERINTKINVIPLREGRSKIEGPGVSCVMN